MFQNQGVFSYIALLRLTSEASTTFVNIEFVLMSFKQENTSFYKLNGLLILLTFFMFRIMPILPIWLSFYNGTTTIVWIKINLFYKTVCILCSAPLDMMNIFWFGSMLKIGLNLFLNNDTVIKTN